MIHTVRHAIHCTTVRGKWTRGKPATIRCFVKHVADLENGAFAMEVAWEHA